MTSPARTQQDDGGIGLASALSLEDQILVALRRITRAIDLRSRTLLQDYGLTAPQLTSLHAISRLQPVKAGGVAKEIHLGQPTVTGILTRLEHRGLIQRTRGERDRRSLNVRLTEEGERVLRDAPSLLQDQFLQKLAELKEWERTQILATLQRIAGMMDAGAIDAAPVLSSELVDATAGDAPFHIEETEAQPDTSPESPPDAK
ncbi:MAG: MarR family transcriptional regulator [Planctomycetes bacterium]|nr:MarR family transcriptional regulator [Planctomycetota bacterium]MBL7043576.1 MarR family transcriptional regulator [Pirellulaceae bacterium]